MAKMTEIHKNFHGVQRKCFILMNTDDRMTSSFTNVAMKRFER